VNDLLKLQQIQVFVGRKADLPESLRAKHTDRENVARDDR
jgi:hypothetical protein